MKAIMVMYDSLNRRMLPNYGCDWVKAPNFERLGKRCVTFDNSFVGSMPCIPARREIHTGRYNFLHRSWGPLEPYDDSMPEILWNHGIYTHLCSDHEHYFEDGGATYHERYTTFEFNRGQEGDPWKPLVNVPPKPKHLGSLWDQDWINRQFLKTTADLPQTKTFDEGIEFLDLNHDADNWFVQIETFDPHEPYYVMQEYKNLYGAGKEEILFDWPPYRKVSDEERPYVEQVRRVNAALISMCDHSLGRVLDKMDEYHLWDDTLLIVNTDHGFFLGEHDSWSKTPDLLWRQEVANTPLFIYDPHTRAVGRRKSLVQTMDLAPTILDFFCLEIPKDMQGKSLLPVIKDDAKVHDAVIFGSFGSSIACTDGRYKYILAPNEDNWPLYQYTVMPMHMRRMFAPEEFEGVELSEPFSFTKGCRLMKFPDREYIGGAMGQRNRTMMPNAMTVKPHQKRPDNLKTELYDLQKDPDEFHPIQNREVVKRLRREMVKLMIENDAPREQYERMNLQEEYNQAIKKIGDSNQ